MVKFYKPGRVVVVLNGRNAGKKGIIIKSNYENTKDRKFPHCLVVGLAKGPRKVTKASLKRLDERAKKLEGELSSKKDQGSLTAQINRMKKLGVFIKTYNMTHLLATRYFYLNLFLTYYLDTKLKKIFPYNLILKRSIQLKVISKLNKPLYIKKNKKEKRKIRKKLKI